MSSPPASRAPAARSELSSSEPGPSSRSWLPLALALATLGATYVLLLLGSTVHMTGSSLACPDWPLCYGQVFPEMRGGVAIEHSHRLLASGVGLLTIALTVVLFVRRSRSRWLSLGALALVIVQGVLGGLTVLFRLPTAVSSAHLATSMLFASLIGWITLRVWRDRRPPREPAAASPATLGVLARAPSAALPLLGALLVWLQMILGALVRHTGAALACADELPLCRTFGFPTLWPEEGPSQLHMAHRIAGVTVGTLVLLVAAFVAARARRGGDRGLLLAALVPAALVLVQVSLGVANVLLYSGPAIATVHLGGGAALLLSLVSLACVLADRRRWAAARGEACPVAPAASDDVGQPSGAVA